MSDLIRRQDVIDMVAENTHSDYIDMSYDAMEYAINKIPSAPPRVIAEVKIDKDEFLELIEKQMEDFIRHINILQCKDCKYWNHEVDLTYCERVGWTGTDAYDYCSFAERKEE